MKPASLIWWWALAAAKHAFAFLSNKPISHTETVFTAKIYENSTIARLSEDLDNLLPKGESCSVRVEWLFPSQEKTPVPFGYSQGTLVLLDGYRLDCEFKRIYDIVINSHCIENNHSISARVRVFIADVNEYKPVFSQTSYVTRYVEGESLSFILKVAAYDNDCVNDHNPCSYKIITPDVPFQVNAAGLIWPTTPLDPNVQKYEFEVVAIDCTDGSQSDPAVVVVYTEAACKPRFKVDTSQQFDLAHPFRNILLILCPFCKPIDIVSRVSLEFDKPELLVCSETKCENGLQIVENLLEPYESMDSKEPPADATYSFNGDDDFLVVEYSSNLPSLYENNLNIQFWMRLNVDLEPNLKRQIICESDTSDLNRHHFAIYVKNGMLYLLRRHQPMLVPANHEFVPSEWNWNISRYIDKRWHKYTVTIKFPKVELHVDFNRDSLTLENSPNGWPPSEISLENPPKTNLTVGACWHGRSEQYVQNFYGDLAGLQLTFYKTRRSDCYQNCSQRLEMRSQNLAAGQSYALGRNKSTVVLRASSVEKMLDLFNRLYYIQPENPIAVSVLLNGTVICENMPKILISELWLRTSREKVNYTGSLDHEGNWKQKLDEKENIGKGLIRTTPGFVYSGWMLIIVVTLASGLAMLALTMIVNNRYATHQRCPTEELEWDGVNYHVTTNPLRRQNNPMRNTRKCIPLQNR